MFGVHIYDTHKFVGGWKGIGTVTVENNFVVISCNVVVNEFFFKLIPLLGKDSVMRCLEY
jgi:hypothetical protein